jgi:hypothetical protein
MERHGESVTCHWLTPTWLMPHPYRLEAAVHPWSCIRESCPRPVDVSGCAMCQHWKPRTFESAARDLVFETWGTGKLVQKPRTFEEARRHFMLETWGVEPAKDQTIH